MNDTSDAQTAHHTEGLLLWKLYISDNCLPKIGSVYFVFCLFVKNVGDQYIIRTDDQH
jgi:hypothetical protein